MLFYQNFPLQFFLFFHFSDNDFNFNSLSLITVLERIIFPGIFNFGSSLELSRFMLQTLKISFFFPQKGIDSFNRNFLVTYNRTNHYYLINLKTDVLCLSRITKKIS